MKLRAAVAAALAGLALAGCATVRGSQDAPAAFTPSTRLVSFDAALAAYNQPADASHDQAWRMGMTRDSYRDYVIDIYLDDIENKYRRFKQQLNSADRGSALAGDLVLLGLTGATALAGPSAIDELATITAVATGTRAAIDKRLFFDRTMPAVIAAMDARRATIKADIAIRRRSDAPYTLGEAIADLIRLADAGDINVGVERITTSATADRAAAEARLRQIVEGCSEATPETAARNDELRELLMNNATRLEQAAHLLGVEPVEGKAIAWSDIAPAFDRKYCGNDAGRRAFIDTFSKWISASEGGGDGHGGT